VRTVSSLLHPQLLEQSGLLPTLRWYLDTFASRTGVRVDAKVPESMTRLNRDRETALFRVTQEWLNGALSNGAKVVRFRLVAGNDEVEMTIEAHDGDWLPEVLDQLKTGTGELGATYAGLKQRLKQLGGQLDVRTRDSGVILRARMPAREDKKLRL
jgi:signal transduction histidine kinase